MKNLYFLFLFSILALGSKAQIVLDPSSGCVGNSFTITISGLPAASTSSCGSAATAGITSGNTVVVTASPVGNVLYQQTSTTAGISLPGNLAPGTYGFTYTGPGNNGCTTTTTCTACFTVLAAPQITNVSGPSTVCNGDTVNYTATTSVAAGTYNWQFPSGWNTSVATNQSSTPVVAGAGSGKIYVIATNTCGNGNVDSTFTVTADDVPAQPVVTAAGANLTSSSNLATQQWYFNNTLINSATGPSYTATQTGSYTVVASNNCGNSVASAPVQVTVSGLNDPALASLQIYPNPVQGNLQIQNNSSVALQASLFGLDGRLIETIAVRETAVFNMQPLAAGVYTLKVSNGENTRIEKITKQ